MSDYERIAKAIEFIRTNIGNQPSLAEIAAEIHLSEYHFQRLFSRWAGVTPKRYLQILTLENAKTLLRQNQFSSLETSYELGLSSGSRLYDHFVQIEAVTPSEFRTRGQGLCINYGYHPTPYGQMFIALTDKGICQLDFIEPGAAEEPLQQLRKLWRNAEFREALGETSSVAHQLFAKTAADGLPISLWVRGTNFQLSVWRALLKIPPGMVASYTDIAEAAGKPKAVRAVGTAIGANPVGLIIPCHRVLRQSGELGGYRWGITRKQAILARECANYDEDFLHLQGNKAKERSHPKL